ncbi:DUF3150 domain-containing protein (plasmid) [Flagellatimonas centrodinii]|uniref:DUF3150 domain-containing protein n=1 Tax=Flagellatimonas centrodinii TaxID=2806210 RepID=UPI001FFC74AD|nr:DUF3150 domain-containing protein [Flagellatimonas centrodinii]ULQ48431.1 DUF3150 domain-containing protein [Flagellatimonas centrodinii]
MSREDVMTRGDLVAVRFSCHQVSPTRTLDGETVKSVLGTVSLPKGLDTLLRQEVISREVLRPFGAVDKRCKEWFEYRAVKTELGYIIDPRLMPEASAKLAEEKAKYEEELPKLVASYADACSKRDDEIAKAVAGVPYGPGLQAAVKAARPSLSSIEESVYMEFYFFHVGQINDGFDEEAEAAVQSGVVNLRKDLPGMACREVAKLFGQQEKEIARREQERGMTGKIRQTTVEVALKGAEKLFAVSFLDRKIQTLGNQVHAALKGYVGTGPLDGDRRKEFLALLNRLSSQRHLVRCMETGADPTAGPAKVQHQQVVSPPPQLALMQNPAQPVPASVGVGVARPASAGNAAPVRGLFG